MTNKRLFSLSAIFLIILLAIRFIAQIYLSFISFSFANLVNMLYGGTCVFFAIFYLMALIGVIKKTVWGLNYALVVIILDIVLGVFMGFAFSQNINSNTIGAIVTDLIMIYLVTNIQKRIKKHK